MMHRKNFIQENSRNRHFWRSVGTAPPALMDRAHDERMVDNMKWYAAEIEDDNFEMILANSEEDAIKQYFELGDEHDLFNLIELDADYNEVRTIL